MVDTNKGTEEKKEATIVVFNKGAGRFTIKTDLATGKMVHIEPDTSKELPASQAAKLIKMYPREIVDVSKMAKTQTVADIKAIKDRDEQIAALQAKIVELEKKLTAALEAAKKEPAAPKPAKPATTAKKAEEKK
jgi:hypothetical protein